jgi:hypothetical protein
MNGDWPGAMFATANAPNRKRRSLEKLIAIITKLQRLREWNDEGRETDVCKLQLIKRPERHTGIVALMLNAVRSRAANKADQNSVVLLTIRQGEATGPTVSFPLQSTLANN